MAAAKLPMMPWFPDSFFGATTGWRLDEIGLYQNLLGAQWMTGPLPTDREQLALHGRCTLSAFQAAWTPRVAAKFLEQDGVLLNPRLEEHRCKSVTFKARASAGGQARAKQRAKTGAKARAKKAAKQGAPEDASYLLSLISEPSTLNEDISVASQPHSRKEREMAVQTVFKHWQKVHGKHRSVLDIKRRHIITRALEHGYPAATLCEAISGLLHSPHHMGHNDTNTRYVDIEHCIGSPKRVDHGLECLQRPPRTDLSKTTKHNINAVGDWVPKEMRNADG